MIVDPDSSWQLRIRRLNDGDSTPGNVIGAGFAVTGHEALTCAHVINDAKECWVELRGGEHETQRCKVQTLQPAGDSADSRSDIAVINLLEPVQSAPLGPRNPPIEGAELEVIGFPRSYGAREQRARVRVTGPVANGLLQVNGQYGHSGIVEGFSGSAAVDLRSRRVVGMVVEADRDPSCMVAWIIPLATIAGFWKQLGDLLPKSLSVDPEFCGAVKDLEYGAYGDALNRLNGILQDYPKEADVFYYRVLAELRGKRPGGYTRPVIEAVVRLLDRALSLNPQAGHVKALLALVREDYYVLRGLVPTSATAKEPLQISPQHAEEILRHVPAPECPTWQYLCRGNPR